ncbi:hypothetical protein [Anaeromicropila populeti]|uniref:Uncharacterized protein n=1 Tax=Anaeromicropila populeti TaxID=37658 RepID=A0A1I6IQ23_9FIRM|nr:hypothetical protein [Anaeromicropila populeti]SFR68833.1 hypothetical protein SAMN05661086_01015 [Anaeromicropila populeti]
MKKNKYFSFYIGMVCLAVILTACSKDGLQKPTVDVDQPNVSTEEADTTDIPATEAVEAEEENLLTDYSSLTEKLESVPFTIQDKAHNIYYGSIGTEEVYLDIWSDVETNEAQIVLVSSFYAEPITMETSIENNRIIYQDTSYFLALAEIEDSSLTGFFAEEGGEPQEVRVTLNHINSSPDKEHLYAIGENEDVEEFALKIIDAVNAGDFQAFADYVEYPVVIMAGDIKVSVDTKEQLLEIGMEKVFTEGLQECMINAYSNLMFSNEDGVMVGTGSNNIWFTENENGEYKIIAINN